MIVTLSGVTGIGKSFFKNVIVKELNFKNLVIYTTREKRKGEIDGVDKNFISDKEFEILKKNNNISFDFEFLGSKYGYSKSNLQSDENQVTEVHYSTIYEFKKRAKDLFAIYMIPSDVKRAKIELKKRNLPKEVQKKRLDEIEEHIKEFNSNKVLQSQFDYIFINDYTDNAKEKLINVIKKKIKQEVKV